MKIRHNTCIAIITLLIINSCSAQFISINTQVSILPETIVSSIGGGVWVMSSGVLTNEGQFHIQEDFSNDGQTYALDGSLFKLKGNWINNESFMAIAGNVVLDSSHQFIMGDEVSYFHHLSLVNGIKTLQKNTSANSLFMQSTHLTTSEYDFEITSTEKDAIQTDGSWISSLGDGKLIRPTLGYYDYLYPVGSSYEENLYRPIIVSPKIPSLNRVGIRMVNYNATIDGYNTNKKDEAIWIINPYYYHLIERIVGNSSFDLTFNYTSNEIDAETVAHWNNEWDFQFNTSGETNSGAITALNVSDFSTSAFALASLYPQVFVPNAFTPDGNGINDTFHIFCQDFTDLKNFKFQIFNRWGQSIFETTDPQFHWAGGENYYAESDAFNWIMSFTRIGTTETKVSKGHITILR